MEAKSLIYQIMVISIIIKCYLFVQYSLLFVNKSARQTKIRVYNIIYIQDVPSDLKVKLDVVLG